MAAGISGGNYGLLLCRSVAVVPRYSHRAGWLRAEGLAAVVWRRADPDVREVGAVWEQIGRLHAHHGEVPAEIRLLKLTEEVGEAAEALIGMRGMNPRKPPGSRDDLLAELADVVIAAAIALTGVAGDVDQARGHLERRLAAVSERAGL